MVTSREADLSPLENQATEFGNGEDDVGRRHRVKVRSPGSHRSAAELPKPAATDEKPAHSRATCERKDTTANASNRCCDSSRAMSLPPVCADSREYCRHRGCTAACLVRGLLRAQAKAAGVVPVHDVARTTLNGDLRLAPRSRPDQAQGRIGAAGVQSCDQRRQCVAIVVNDVFNRRAGTIRNFEVQSGTVWPCE